MMTFRENLPSRYKYKRRISSGSFGEVYLVIDNILGKTVALKILKKTSNEAARSLKKEFSILSTLDHPNLVKVFDFGFTKDNKPFFTMELLKGMNLREYFQETRNIEHLYDIIHQALLALRHLHNNKVLHGDIKPENIIVTSDARLKLLDFGLIIAPSTKRIKISGTPGYIAPEVLKEKIYSETSDLFSLGVTLSEAITGKINPSYEELKAKLFSLGVKNHLSFSNFIFGLMANDPLERPRNTDQALLALELCSNKAGSIRVEIPSNKVFVGRRKELRIAQTFLNRITDNKALIIEGLKGIGKRSYIEKVIKKAQLKGYVITEIDESNSKDSPIETLFNLIAKNLNPESAGKLINDYRQTLSLYKQGKDIESIVDKSYLNDLYINLVELIIKAANDIPLIIVINNIDKFDRGFIQFINIIFNSIAVKCINNILLIISFNNGSPVKNKDLIENLLEHEISEKIYIRSLNKKEVKEMLQVSFGMELFLKDEVNLIYKYSAGIPLLINELINYFISSGYITKKDGIWKMKVFKRIPSYIPNSFFGLFSERYKNMKIGEKRILQILALFGGAMNVALLLEVSSSSSNELRMLHQNGIIKFINNNIALDNTSYIEAIKRLIPSRTKRRIAYLLASYLEKYNYSITKIAELYLESEYIDKSYKYVTAAYNNLVINNELYKAYALLSKLKTLLSKHNEKEKLVTILDKLAPIEELIGKVKDAIEDYKYIIENAGNYELKAYNMLKLGSIIIHENRRKAKMLYEEAYKLIRKSKNNSLISLCLTKLSDFRGGMYKEKMLIKAKNTVPPNDYRTLGIIYDYLIRYYKYSGKEKMKEYILNKLLEISKYMPNINKVMIYSNILTIKLYDSDYKFMYDFINNKKIMQYFNSTHYGKMQLLNQSAALSYIFGDYNKLIANLKKAISSELIRGDYNRAIVFMFNLIVGYKNICKYSAAIETFDEILKLSKKRSCSRHLLSRTIPEARLWLLLGKYYRDKYRIVTQTNLQIALKDKDIFRLGHYNLVRYDYNLVNMNKKRSYKFINKAITLFRKVKSRDDLCEALLKKSVILCELGEPKKARRYIKQAWSIYEQIHCEYLLPQLLLAKGMVERLNGKNEAIETLREALKVSRKQLTREQTWQIQREMALYYRDKGQYRRALKYYKDAVETIKQITESIPTEEIKISYLEVPFRKRVFEEIKELKKRLVN